jgi:hypothetical protein
MFVRDKILYLHWAARIRCLAILVPKVYPLLVEGVVVLVVYWQDDMREPKYCEKDSAQSVYEGIYS